MYGDANAQMQADSLDDSPWGGCWFDHYARFFRKQPAGVEVYRHASLAYALQVLRYDHVFPACQTYGTVGFSHYSRASCGRSQEVILAVDNGFDRVSTLLAQTLLYLAAYEVSLSIGLSKGGIHDLDQSFVTTFGKEALYFTDPYPLPQEFQHVVCHLSPHHHAIGEIYLAIFLSKEEHDFVKVHGADTCAHLMQDADVDPIDLRRPSAISG